MDYAAFVMTYRRPEILRVTIEKLLNQTLAPKYILVVDNDPEESAREVAVDKKCGYYAVGHNSGPAGAAYWGLKLLFEEGWKWVLWVDDDDPPTWSDQLREIAMITKAAPEYESLGIVGAVGAQFLPWVALIRRIPDRLLSGLIPVNSIAGSQLLMIHRRVYEAGVLPDPLLFFGFEELDFCRRVKKVGYHLWVSGNLMLRLRHYYDRIGIGTVDNWHWGQKMPDWRAYYSTRNMAYLLVYRERSVFGIVALIFRLGYKIIREFCAKPSLGYAVLNIHATALYHGVTGRLGKVWSPSPL